MKRKLFQAIQFIKKYAWEIVFVGGFLQCLLCLLLGALLSSLTPVIIGVVLLICVPAICFMVY